MISYNSDPQQNFLINALPRPTLERLSPMLELIHLQQGQVLYELNHPLFYVYFPTTSVVSLLNLLENGTSAEIAAVGNEGMVGVSLFMSSEPMHNLAVVQSAGHAYRLKGSILRQELNRSGGRRNGMMQTLLLHYTQALITQTAQTAVCNRHHSIEQQLCRYLLSTLDRLPSEELAMTQELIANMLGVRREGITEAAGKLQKKGLINYSRGHITIIDRPGLENQACECYKVIKQEFMRLLAPYHTPHQASRDFISPPKSIHKVIPTRYIHK
jgi:CRP-like cAMP-binding protein